MQRILIKKSNGISSYLRRIKYKNRLKSLKKSLNLIFQGKIQLKFNMLVSLKLYLNKITSFLQKLKNKKILKKNKINREKSIIYLKINNRFKEYLM
ncbi:hypothetical protein E5P55_00475 [Candidatus Pinguicoccus supinus]|uniref:Uncharacterized protein n=1 Tax=Candidatus Pinguicoccus supinus TaxID=2529394 RepID=A0A7T0BRT2_9BACT|nr:hypothetical protein E5P55_00475 [Candidatus Pinguicoccus supinus]